MLNGPQTLHVSVVEAPALGAREGVKGAHAVPIAVVGRASPRRTVDGRQVAECAAEMGRDATSHAAPVVPRPAGLAGERCDPLEGR